MLNNNLIKLFDVLSSITKTIIIKYPITVGKSEDSAMSFLVDLSEFDSDSFEKNLCFNNNLDKFLSIFKLFNDYDVQIDKDVLTVTSKDQKIKSDFILSDPTLMQSYDIPPEIFNRIEGVPEVCQFELDKDNIKNIRNACGIFSDLTDLIFKSDDVTDNTETNGVIEISLGNFSKFNARSNSYKLRLDAKFNKNINIRIPVELFKSIPLCDYKIGIKYSANKNTYRLLCKSKEFKNLQILISTAT